MSKTKNLAKYKVTCKDIVWDTDSNGEPAYNQKIVKRLPKTSSVYVFAYNEAAASEFGLSDVSDNGGFCIESCKVTVTKI